MYSTSVYFFIPRQTVVLNVGSSPRRYQTVYAKNLKLHKGVDNRIQFQFLNQEQKPVDVTDKEITIRIIDGSGTTTLIKAALSAVLPLNGIMELILPSAALEDINAQKAQYSIEIPSGQFDLPVFVAGDGGARGVIEILNSILPAHVPSMEVGIMSHPQPDHNTVTFYSDIIDTTANPVLTIQSFLNNYSGTVNLQGSTVPNTDWYDLGVGGSYIDTTGGDMYTVRGFHPYVRIQFVCTQGTVDKLIAR